MTSVPAWVAPTIAISLGLIALSLLVLIGVAVALALGARQKGRALTAQLTGLTTDARAVSARLRSEVEGYADLGGEARTKLKAAMETIETRLRDLDALAEVLQEEVEEAALSAATLLRTVRTSGKVLGVARRALKRRPHSSAEHAG